MVAAGDSRVPARRPAPHRNEHVVPDGSRAGSGITFQHHQIHRALPGDGGRGIRAEPLVVPLRNLGRSVRRYHGTHRNLNRRELSSWTSGKTIPQPALEVGDLYRDFWNLL